MANRLARESSPYLLLHKDNPVDWYPWGEEAFARARAEEKPIFLSVGYSTCYWCHVMERESFSSAAIARELNDGFVCIKVDREERPDVDEIYMTATQLITRSGGWPNSVFLTPDLKPFYAGTYFPPEDGRGRPGFGRLLQSLREAWLFRRPELLQQAEMVAQAMEQHLAPRGGRAETLPGADVADALLEDLASRFDPDWGGFGPAPKFPTPANLFFLLERSASDEARGMLVTTLDRMARGGLMDQLAGGFHRYSTDEAWLVPHFEKMLYDNASLAWLYAEASALAPGLGFEGVARFTLDFVQREMTGPEGGFYSAIDAETGGHEGAYYTWTAPELDAALTGDEGRLFRVVYGLEGPPTFEGERYVLYLHTPLGEQARAGGLSAQELQRRLAPGRQALLEARSRRERPLTDDKVLADWNGLAIGAMARAGARLAEPRYLAAAERAAGFVLSRLAAEGTLVHVYRDGRAQVPALLDDYAFLVEGLLQLYGATGEKRWLTEAARLAEEQERRLGDPRDGGCFAAGEDEHLLFRSKPGFDGAVASGNGVAALNAVELARLTGEPAWASRAESTLLAFVDAMARAPLAHVTLVRALERLGDVPRAAAAAPPREAPAAAAPPSSESLEEEAYDAVEIDGRLGSSDDDDWKPFRLELAVRAGWHVNGNPAGAGLVPTSVAGVVGGVRNVRYPVGEGWDGGAGPVPVYRGRVAIEGEVERRGGGAASLEVTYQACADARCLPPVARIVRLR
ncbi:MAG TPA: DUF255 domain-containing protein [Vicinamibacteria bacterium]|nr:DUF255 domain-containing protein [Vicinamibacteria bacterium]